MDFILTKRNGKVEVAPLRHCLYRLGDHPLEYCLEKYDLFALTGPDQKFFQDCGISPRYEFNVPWLDSAGRFIGA